jgi:MFS family permease
VIAIAATLPILIAKWQLTPWEIGFLIGSGSVGQLIGAFVFPWYAERKGRVKAIALSSGIIGITSIACVRFCADVRRVRRAARDSGSGARR